MAVPLTKTLTMKLYHTSFTADNDTELFTKLLDYFSHFSCGKCIFFNNFNQIYLYAIQHILIKKTKGKSITAIPFNNEKSFINIKIFSYTKTINGKEKLHSFPSPNDS